MHLVSRTSIAQGFAAMAVNPLRTTLCTLGVMMGIASVVATLSVGDGLERFARDQIASQTDVQAVAISSRTEVLRDGFAFPNHGYPVFTAADAEDLRAFLGSRGEVTMSVSGQTTVSTPSTSTHAAAAIATLANYLIVGRKDVWLGRYFTDVEVAHNAPVVVLSYKLAAELARTHDAGDMLGRDVRVRGRAFTVVGIMPTFTGESGFQIFIPLRGAAAAFGSTQRLTPAMLVHAPSLELVDATKAHVIDWLATRYRDWESSIRVATQLLRLEQARTGMLVLKLVMGAFAAISLLVGGVGIMNVLLAGVTERTREIGVRKAMGARRRDILQQFLAESVAMAGVGTGIGTIVGLAAAFAVAWVVRWQVPGAELHAAVTMNTLTIAVTAAVSIGLAFGTFPALRAARLSPIDAIRHE